jgi:TolA-binding protein
MAAPSKAGVGGLRTDSLDMFELESKLRTLVSHLMDPVVSRQSADRVEAVRLQLQLHQLNEKVHVLENVLFEKDENGRMQLFDRVFDAIKEVDQQRIVEE